MSKTITIQQAENGCVVVWTDDVLIGAYLFIDEALDIVRLNFSGPASVDNHVSPPTSTQAEDGATSIPSHFAGYDRIAVPFLRTESDSGAEDGDDTSPDSLADDADPAAVGPNGDPGQPDAEAEEDAESPVPSADPVDESGFSAGVGAQSFRDAYEAAREEHVSAQEDDHPRPGRPLPPETLVGIRVEVAGSMNPPHQIDVGDEDPIDYRRVLHHTQCRQTSALLRPAVWTYDVRESAVSDIIGDLFDRGYKASRLFAEPLEAAE